MQPTQYLDVLRSRRRHSLAVRGLTRIYPGGVRALDDVTLTMDAGLCGIVGPEGAGKSTLMRILSLAERPDRGTVHLGALDSATHAEQVQRLISVAPPTPRLREDLSVAEAIAFGARGQRVRAPLSPTVSVEAQLRQVGLWDVRDVRVDALPAAMHWRLMLAYYLADSPRAMLFDEPMANLNSREAKELLALLTRIAQTRIVVISAPDVSQLRDLSMQLVLLHRGRILREGAVDRLVDALRGRVWGGAVPLERVSDIADRYPLLSRTTRDHAAEIEVLADSAPMEAFTPIEPDVSHVYHEAFAGLLP